MAQNDLSHIFGDPGFHAEPFFYENVAFGGNGAVYPNSDVELIPTPAGNGEGENIPGESGAQGIQGVQGTSGNDGIQGVRGFYGIQGLTGLQGPQGSKGKNGSNGLQGIKGLQGFYGIQGIQGPSGAGGSGGTSSPDLNYTKIESEANHVDVTFSQNQREYIKIDNNRNFVLNITANNTGDNYVCVNNTGVEDIDVTIGTVNSLNSSVIKKPDEGILVSPGKSVVLTISVFSTSASIIKSSENTTEVEEWTGLKFTAVDDNFRLSLKKFNSSSPTVSIEYSLNEGKTWSSFTSSTTTDYFCTLAAGDTVCIRGNVDKISSNGQFYNQFVTTNARFTVSGDIRSLLQNTSETLTSDNTYCFAHLFHGCQYLTDASELLLSYTSLASYCYDEMFYGCLRLTAAPELPATTLAAYCYYGMFNGCSALTQIPELNATALQTYCYAGMFKSCSALTSIRQLPVTSIPNYACYEMFYGCYNITGNITPFISELTSVGSYGCASMFYGCTKITGITALPATTIESYSYNQMFRGCTALVNTPEYFPASSIPSNAYDSMFYGCTSLVTAPDISGRGTQVTLGIQCFTNMFYGCTNLVQGPALPNTTLADYCYEQMFYGCTKLKGLGKTDVIKLPAKKVSAYAYYRMFYNCTSITCVPTIAAVTLSGYNSMREMFYNCTSISVAPALHVKSITNDYCQLNNMFKGCTFNMSNDGVSFNFVCDFDYTSGCYDYNDNGACVYITSPIYLSKILGNTTGFMYFDITSIYTPESYEPEDMRKITVNIDFSRNNYHIKYIKCQWFSWPDSWNISDIYDTQYRLKFNGYESYDEFYYGNFNVFNYTDNATSGSDYSDGGPYTDTYSDVIATTSDIYKYDEDTGGELYLNITGPENVLPVTYFDDYSTSQIANIINNRHDWGSDPNDSNIRWNYNGSGQDSYYCFRLVMQLCDDNGNDVVKLYTDPKSGQLWFDYGYY